MRRIEVDILLEALDKSANSNSYWITLPISEDKNLLSHDIVQHLRTGSFHFQLVKEDIQRGFNDYSEILFAKGFDTPIFLPKPGNVWNGNEQLTINPISKQETNCILHDLLTGEQKLFSKNPHGTQFNNADAQILIQEFFKSLDQKGNWKAYNLKTNFLNKIDDYYNSNYIQLGYFENCKRDLALGIKYDDEINILLTNGYG